MGTRQFCYWVLWGLTVQWIDDCAGERGKGSVAVAVPRLARPLTNNLKSLPFEEAYMPLFGDSNVQVSEGGNSVKLILDKRSGSGLISHDLYHFGFFSASIKLPEDYTAGVVTAFYTSNGDIFEQNHDELDFEFLGNIRGKEWRVQTNVYGNGSTNFGREERYKLWFDPTEDFHQYSILWTDSHIIFFIDDIPIREVERSEAMGGQYPLKPMSVYTTIWDGSEWATAGGRYKVNYKYAPFTMELSNLILEGCAVDPIEQEQEQEHEHEQEKKTQCAEETKSHTLLLSEEQRKAMEWFRGKYIYYSYCDDTARYPSQLPECPLRDPKKPIATANLKFGRHRSHHRKRTTKSRSSSSSSSALASV